MRAILIAGVLLLCAYPAVAQDSSASEGKSLFRSNCAFCHGLTGRGGRGPSLVDEQQKTDEAIRAIIRDGVPGSTMPAFNSFEDSEMKALVGFIRSLNSAGGAEKVAGDAIAGRAVYERNGCAACHQVGAAGSTFGPDLTRIGGARSVSYLRESIVDPSADVPETYQGVSVVTKDGKRTTGIRINEDTFTVQLRVQSQQFRSFVKDDVAKVSEEPKSLMPAYKNLPEQDLDNLIAYLLTLRGDVDKNSKAKKAEGIH